MHTLAKVLFILGAITTAGGVAILVALAPRPTQWKESRSRALHDHLQGISRYLIAGSLLLQAAQAMMGWTPSWLMVALSVGLGMGMGMHARAVNLLALAQERLEQVSRDAGA